MWQLRTFHVAQTDLMNGNAVPSHLQDIPCKPHTDRNGLHLTGACCSFVHLLYSVLLLLSAVLTSCLIPKYRCVCHNFCVEEYFKTGLSAR